MIIPLNPIPLRQTAEDLTHQILARSIRPEPVGTAKIHTISKNNRKVLSTCEVGDSFLYLDGSKNTGYNIKTAKYFLL
jgi:hypothetical protein